MILTYQGAILVTANGIRRDPLVINTFTGRILPSERANRKNVIDASGLYLYPGLINAHDHLEFNHYPRTKTRDVYPNAREWAVEMTPLLDQEPIATLRKYPIADQCWIGGLKNLFSGVTTVAHHNPLHPPLKRRDFPVRVLKSDGWAHSLYLWEDQAIQHSYRKTRRGVWMIHLAEGTDDYAAEEIDHLKKLGCLSDKTILIHGAGLPSMIPECGGLVWCPSSNFFLLGKTAAVKDWYGKLALGSDSRLTADGDLLDELKAAYRTGQLSAEQLFHLVTDHAARLLRLSDVGELSAGKRADILALPASLDSDPYMALIKASRHEVIWVMRDGKIRWKQDKKVSNCTLDGIPYRIDDPERIKKNRLQEPGLMISE